MNRPPSNRMELLAVKKKKKLATTGHQLLTKKRDALIQHFFSYVKEYKRLASDVTQQLQEAYTQLHVAQAVSGVNRVKSLAYSTQESFLTTYTEKNLMGVRINALELQTQAVKHNASLIGISEYVMQAQKQFQTVVPLLVKLAEIEQTIYALAEEIRKTKRRVNALEHIYIPELESTQKTIAQELAEREREEFTRLKHIKEHGR
ncbi:MAG: V-type ATP synthase subunit D [Candidatus Woesearchaeota archaeon]